MPVSSLRERFRGGQGEGVHRILAQGQSSYLRVSELKETLAQQELEVIICSSEDLARAAKPQVAVSASPDVGRLTFVLEDGSKRLVDGADIYLLLVYGEESTSETLTRKGPRDAAGGGSRRNILDIYSSSEPAAVRVHGDDFDWSLLGTQQTSSAEANFGRFLSILESHSPDAIIHTVNDNHPRRLERVAGHLLLGLAGHGVAPGR